MTNILNFSQSPYFKSSLSSTVSNVTGDGTTYTAIWDTLNSGSGYNTGTGIFTSPMSGDYLFSIRMDMTGLTSSMTSCIANLVATSGTFRFSTFNIGASRTVNNSFMLFGIVPVRMALGDTAYVTLQISNGTKVATFGTLSVFSGIRVT